MSGEGQPQLSLPGKQKGQLMGPGSLLQYSLIVLTIGSSFSFPSGEESLSPPPFEKG